MKSTPGQKKNIAKIAKKHGIKLVILFEITRNICVIRNFDRQAFF